MSRMLSLFVMMVLLVTGYFVYDMANQGNRYGEEKFITVQGTKKAVEIPKRPKRIAFLTASSLELWLAAGGREQIIARPSATLLPDDVLQAIPASAVDLGQTNNISIENVLKQSPDLVVGSPMVKVQQNMVQPLDAAGIPFLTMPNYSVADICAELALYGQLTGDKTIAKARIDSINGRIAQEAKRREGKAEKKVLLIWGTPVSFTMALDSSRQGDILRLAGGKNIAVDPGTGANFLPFSIEFAVEQDPDYVLFMTHGNREKLALQMNKTLSESSSWQSIRAVREGRVDVLPPELFAVNPGPRIDEAVIYLSKLLYPDD